MSSDTSPATSSVIRVSVASEGRRLDVGVPSQVPIVELLPGFARTLGVLDPSLAHGGYALQRADGSRLDPALTCGAQGVQDGDLLTLARGIELAQPRVYDDIVEAVIDATTAQHRPWTAQDNARTALAIGLGLVALSALALALIGPGAPLAWIVAVGGAVVLAATGVVVGRLGQREASAGLGLGAALIGAVGAWLAVAGMPGLGEQPWGWPLAAAGLAAAILGAAGLAAAVPREPHLVPVLAGVAIAIPAALVGALGADTVAAFALQAAIAGSLVGLIPWLALSSTRLKAVSPQSDQEILAAPEPVDASDVAARVAAGARVAVAVRVGLAVSILVATPLVAASGPWGALLAALAFAGMLFPARQTYSRVGVLAVMAAGAVGLFATGVVIALQQPELHLALLIVLLATTAVLVTLTMLDRRVRVALSGVADAADVIVIALLLPLGDRKSVV